MKHERDSLWIEYYVGNDGPTIALYAEESKSLAPLVGILRELSTAESCERRLSQCIKATWKGIDDLILQVIPGRQTLHQTVWRVKSPEGRVIFHWRCSNVSWVNNLGLVEGVDVGHQYLSAGEPIDAALVIDSAGERTFSDLENP